MDETDEDIDPLVGPVADLMAEHQLSSTTSSVRKPVESLVILEQKIPVDDYLAVLNIRSFFKVIFDYLLHLQWFRYLNKFSPRIEQEAFFKQSQVLSSLGKLSLLFIIYAILASSLPLPIHLLSFLTFFYLLIIDLFIPLVIYYNWFQCFNALRRFIHIIQTHQQWLIKIHGFQLIRPTSSLFENHLSQLRRTIFEELRAHFLFTRQIARDYCIDNDQLICYIDLNEFGPLIQSNESELEEISNHFDQISINSIFKLCHLQINECIQLIHFNRPKSYRIFYHYQFILSKSLEKLNRIKQNCSMMIDYISSEKASANKFTASYFLLRSNCEQLFQMNDNDSIDTEQLKRIVQDLKTVLYSLEAIQTKSTTVIDQTHTEQTLSNENPPSNISSYHRFDDRIEESIDEILVCETGKLTDEMSAHTFDIDDYDQRLLREQSNCLMKELQIAIQGKKEEWNEREQRLLGNVEMKEEEKKESIEEQPFEKVQPMQPSISMLDELKHSFLLNRKKLNMNEDIFGEEENFDDDE